MVGNKCDLTANKVVSYEAGKALADEVGIPFMETSAKMPLMWNRLYGHGASIKDRMASQPAMNNARPPTVQIRGQQLNRRVAAAHKMSNAGLVGGSISSVWYCRWWHGV
ncbi:GTP-binding protein YPTM2-like [Hibiscus syriacus]|uniref:GTP-binding protein YPTM2-like n=1 Tax=Hibiscus syriacus TaxID=106335 RepID=UPI0019236677|nr:GTP-binding protein YPTM2-like [Hibiscus syriacus]